MCNLTHFVNWCVSLAKEAVVSRAAPAVQKGTGGYADWIVLTIFCLREWEGGTYRSIIGLLQYMPWVRESLDLSRGQLPNLSTVCKALDRLTIALFQSLLQQTVILHELGSIAAIDTSQFRHCSNTNNNTSQS